MKNSKKLITMLAIAGILLGITYIIPPLVFANATSKANYWIDGPTNKETNKTINNDERKEPTNENSNLGEFNGPGMMEGFNGYGPARRGGFGMMGGYQNNSTSVLDEKAADYDISESLKNASINKKDNSITYSGDDVKIVMFAAPKAADEKFVIGGLVNPTIYITKEATMTIEIINEDKGMAHGLEITDAAPPYEYMAMMQGRIYPGSFISPISAAQEDKYSTASTSFKTDYKGEYYYVCQYPGHAYEGMYGKIIIQ